MMEEVSELQLFQSELAYLYGLLMTARPTLPAMILPVHNNIMDKIWELLRPTVGNLARQEFESKIQQVLDIATPPEEP